MFAHDDDDDDTTAEPRSTPIVLLASYANGIAAHMAKNQLEAAGIPSFLSNENRPYGPISGGVRLHVRQHDLLAAQQVLGADEASMHALAATDDDDDDNADTARAGAPRCPRCHHTDVVCRHTPQPSDTLLTRLRLWLLAPARPQCHCFHCGFEFEGQP